MWVLPTLYPDHALPLPAFYVEWIAAVLGLCALSLLVTKRFWIQIKIPHIFLLPVALSLLVLLQFAIGRVVYLEQCLLFILYMVWAALLIVLARHLREELGLPAVTTVLAVFLLVGAELSSLIGILQHYPGHTFLDLFVMPVDSAIVVANIAQPNNLANYLTLGLVSLGLLFARCKLRLWQVVVLASPLLFVLVLTSSRSPWLYLTCLATLAFLWQRRDKLCTPLLHFSLLMLLGFGLMHFVVQIPWLAGPHGNLSAIQRLLTTASQGIRLPIWHEAWLIFAQHPGLGAGFGQFPWQHFQLSSIVRDATLSNLNTYVEHAHNLVMHLAAEMGLAGLLILFGSLGLWLVQAYRAPRTIYHWWGCGVLAVLGIHSMLEYPLWYAYFLGIAAITLGVFDYSTWRWPSKWNMGVAGSGLMVVVLLGGGIVLSKMLPEYNKLAHLFAARPKGDKPDPIILRPIREELIRIHAQPTLLRSNVESQLGEAGWNHTADKGVLNNRVMRSIPSPSALHRGALLLARAGRQSEARAQIERAIWTYPAEFPALQKQLEELARLDRDPSRFPALLSFGLQKYEEWKIETHYEVKE